MAGLIKKGFRPTHPKPSKQSRANYWTDRALPKPDISCATDNRFSLVDNLMPVIRRAVIASDFAIRKRGYTGSFNHLARFLAPWRNVAQQFDAAPACPPADHEVAGPALDPITGRKISPLTAAALCVKPRGQMTARQIALVDTLKAASRDFATMRKLAMRFRGLFRGGSVSGLDNWLADARQSGIHAMQRFAVTIRHDIGAVRNAILEPWINGQAKGKSID